MGWAAYVRRRGGSDLGRRDSGVPIVPNRRTMPLFPLSSTRNHRTGCSLLDAPTHLYRRVCPSLRQAVRRFRGLLTNACQTHLIAGIGLIYWTQWVRGANKTWGQKTLHKQIQKRRRECTVSNVYISYNSIPSSLAVGTKRQRERKGIKAVGQIVE